MNLSTSTQITIAHFQLPSPEWLPSNLSRLPYTVQQIAETFHPKRRQQFLCGRWLLAELLFNQLGYPQLPALITTENGRPSFALADNLDFNISHSGNYITVALAQHCRIGLDIEHCRPRKRLWQIAQYRFSEREYQWLRCLPTSQQEQGFWQLWTLREAIIKLCGKGIWQMKQIQINPLKKQLVADFQPDLFCITSQHDQFTWAIASDKPITPPTFLRLDSQNGFIQNEHNALIGFTSPQH